MNTTLELEKALSLLSGDFSYDQAAEAKQLIKRAISIKKNIIWKPVGVSPKEDAINETPEPRCFGCTPSLEDTCERLSNEEMVKKIFSFDIVKFTYDNRTNEVDTSQLVKFTYDNRTDTSLCCSIDEIYDLSDENLHFITLGCGDKVENFYKTEQGWGNSLTKVGRALTLEQRTSE